MAKGYHVSFEPLRRDAVQFLSLRTAISFHGIDFSKDHEWACCTVRGPDRRVALVIVVEFKTAFDGHLTTAVADPKALSRRMITAMFRAVFHRASRITALVEPDNKVALQQVWRMGFAYEGYMRRAIEGTRDAVLFGLLPEDCPYLRGTPFRMRVVAHIHAPAERMQ